MILAKLIRDQLLCNSDNSQPVFITSTIYAWREPFVLSFSTCKCITFHTLSLAPSDYVRRAVIYGITCTTPIIADLYFNWIDIRLWPLMQFKQYEIMLSWK